MDCVICLNGNPPSEDLLRYYVSKNCCVIAADGACTYLYKYNIMADVAVGDFDSFSTSEVHNVLKDEGCILSYNPDKDYTDGQLALKYALEKGYRTITLLGALGGRVDHEFENIRLLCEAIYNECSIIIATDECEIFMSDSDVEIDSHRNCTVSILPYTDDAIISSLEGFKYIVKDAQLYSTKGLTHSGLSNVIIADNAKIRISKGIFLIFLYKQIY